MRNDQTADQSGLVSGLVSELFGAVYDGADDEVVRLLRAGVSAEAMDADGVTALYVAAVTDEPGIVRLLLAAGAHPDRLSEGTDLPLCGAACGGHTEVVRSLLAAGARADLAEEFGFTALSWAVQLGRAAVAEALLSGGADPGLPGPDGRPPLVAAACRGSVDTVRALLRHGATERRAALDEARRWLGRDIPGELRRTLAEGERDEIVVREVPEGEGVTLIAELFRDDESCAGREQQTGHGAIATLLERDLGLRSPFGELLDRALPFQDPQNENWTESVAELQRRGDEPTYRAAAALTRSPEPWRRVFAVDVLAQLGFTEGEHPFAARALPLLRDAAATIPGPDSTDTDTDSTDADADAAQSQLIQALLLAFAHYGDPVALDDVLRYAGHPDAAVRRRVAFALDGLLPAGHSAGTEVLIALSRDADAEVRDWATSALAGADTASDAEPDAGSDAEPDAVRDALAARLADRDPTVRAEAARGLALRGDPRAPDALLRLLEGADPGGYAYATAQEAVDAIGDPGLRRRLRQTVSRYRG
ncbi:ankyrin repeat domain-containing protein [Streptomyces sp. E11-3]|uniref:ankyrin repeat domain-containing protein n=1 Tax=Streptomyces sp. E11-3 TaxID=3110112 RepID=UPI00397EFE6A